MDEDYILLAALKVGLTFELPPTKLIDFARVIAGIEREECAKMLENIKHHNWNVWDCAAAIRSRT